MALKRMSIKVSEELYDWIAKEAETRGLTMNAVVIFALETYQTQREIIPSMSMMQQLLEHAEQEKQVKIIE